MRRKVESAGYDHYRKVRYHVVRKFTEAFLKSSRTVTVSTIMVVDC